MKITVLFFSMVLALSFSTMSFAGGISTGQKEKIISAMVDYIKSNSTSSGTFLIMDSKVKMTRSLKFGEVHKGVVKHQDGFVACVDMLDGETLVDLDFVVSKEGEEYRVSKIAIHKVGGEKRKGHLDH